MAATWETIGVGVIVGAALLWAARGLWRAGRRKQVCSTCGQAGTCPAVNGRSPASVAEEDCAESKQEVVLPPQ